MSLNESQFGAMSRRAKALKLDDPDCSYGQCRTASSDFQRLHGGEIVEFSHPLDVSEAHEEWQEEADYEPEDFKHVRHAVNKVGENIIDWTPTQFWRKEPVPLIEPADVYKKRFGGGPFPSAQTGGYKHGDYSRTRREIRGEMDY